MNEIRLRQCRQVGLLLSSSMFKEAMETIKLDLAKEMIECEDIPKRNNLYWQNQGLELILSKLQSYANEAVMIEQQRGQDGLSA